MSAADEATSLAVGPVRRAAMREPEIRRTAKLPDLRVVLPERPARRRIDRDVDAERGRRVEDTVHHDRRVLIARGPGDRVGLRDLVVGRAPTPGDLQLVDVGACDLVERRVLGARGVAAVVAPFTCCGRIRSRALRDQDCCHRRNGNQSEGGSDSSHSHRSFRRHSTRVAVAARSGIAPLPR